MLLNGNCGFSFWQVMAYSKAGFRKWGEWHEWFAWYPIRYKGKLIWMQRIWRRLRCENYEPMSCVTYVEYITLHDYLASK